MRRACQVLLNLGKEQSRSTIPMVRTAVLHGQEIIVADRKGSAHGRHLVKMEMLESHSVGEGLFGWSYGNSPLCA
jgi:hypothetical protein